MKLFDSHLLKYLWQRPIIFRSKVWLTQVEEQNGFGSVRFVEQKVVHGMHHAAPA